VTRLKLADAAKNHLILALDFAAPAEANAFVELLGTPRITYKIGLELIYAGGLAYAARLGAQGLDTFIDAKLLDIGQTVERATASIAALGANFLTVHATDNKTLDAAVRGRGAAPMKLLAVTVMTSLEPGDMIEQGIAVPIEELVLRRARMAKDAGFDGVVASAWEAASIRRELGPDLLIVTPGVRAAGQSKADQARVATPAQAITAGADYLVVGRPITRAADPAGAFDAMLAEISEALPPAAG
jgi:orotidine-5'-phosphate decarboxylase